jgi:hypothetical protein
MSRKHFETLYTMGFTPGWPLIAVKIDESGFANDQAHIRHEEGVTLQL